MSTMNKTALREFQDAIIVRNIVARTSVVAMEHSSPEEMKKYLHDHPGADPKDHHVKKKDEGGKAKGKGEDHGPAEAEAKKSQARFDENKKDYAAMKDLHKKVQNADPSAKKKFDRAYDKMFESGEKAADAAKKLLKKYESIADNSKGDEKEQREAALENLHRAITDWDHNKMRHQQAKGGFSEKKLDQAADTYGHAQQLEAFVKGLAGTLKDPNHEIDESWRH